MFFQVFYIADTLLSITLILGDLKESRKLLDSLTEHKNEKENTRARILERTLKLAENKKIDYFPDYLQTEDLSKTLSNLIFLQNLIQVIVNQDKKKFYSAFKDIVEEKGKNSFLSAYYELVKEIFFKGEGTEEEDEREFSIFEEENQFTLLYEIATRNILSEELREIVEKAQNSKMTPIEILKHLDVIFYASSFGLISRRTLKQENYSYIEDQLFLKYLDLKKQIVSYLLYGDFDNEFEFNLTFIEDHEVRFKNIFLKILEHYEWCKSETDKFDSEISDVKNKSFVLLVADCVIRTLVLLEKGFF